MGNIVGKPFGVVASKDYNTALTESVKEGNQAKFYLTENGGKGFNDITATTDDSRNTLIVNGNKIQGVSTSDINKLNLISGSGLITDGAFKYKGSVDNISKLPDDAKVGDVYNISTHFMIGSIDYPAYTSVVYVNDGTNTWQSLGGEMKLGTHAIGLRTTDDNIFYSGPNYLSPNYKPITSFDINLDSDNGLYAKPNNFISIRLGLGLSTSKGSIVPCLGQGLTFDNGGNININPGDGLNFNISSKLQLNLGSGLHFYNGCVYPNLGDNLTIESDYVDDPNGKINVKLGLGLSTSSDGIVPSLGPGLIINSDNKITYKLGSSKDDNNEGDITRCSGLYIDSSYGLNVALATDIYNTNSYISGIVRLGEQDASYGGLAIDSNVLSSWLENDTTVENHIISITRNNLRLGSGLTNSQKNDIQLNLGHCLFINGSDQIDISIGSGLIKDGNLHISCGEGLYFNPDGKLSLNVSNPLNISDNTLKLNIGSGLTINSNNELTVPVGDELEITNSNLIKLNANYLSGTVKDRNKFYYSLGGIYFPDTIKSRQQFEGMTIGPSSTTSGKKDYSLKLRCGTGLAFQEGWEDTGGLESSQILGHDGKYYVNIDNTTIGLNTDSKLRVKHDSTLSESSNGLSVKVGNNLVKGDNGINIQLPVPTPSDLQQLPVSTAGILVNDGNNGLCVDIPALKRLVELIMAAK